jgi:sugar phosphate isomerase/epimerase
MSLSWKDCLAEAAKAGYRNVELLVIPGFVHVTLDEITPQELLTEAARHRVTIIGLHAGGLDGMSDRTIQESSAYVKQVIAFAHAAGIPLVNVNGGYLPPDGNHSPADRLRILQRIAATLQEMEPVLAQSGRRLTLENHFHFQLETAGDYQVIFDSLPAGGHIGFTVDTGHFTSTKVDMLDFIARFGRRVSHVHIKDHIGEKSVPLGQGHTDNHAVIRALAQLRYAGCLSVELEVHDQREVEHARAARFYMDALLKDCGVSSKN